MLDPTRSVSYTEEDQDLFRITAAGANVTAISTLPTIHASRIDVVVEAENNTAVVQLLIYAGSKALLITETLGTVGVGDTAGFVYGTGANEVVGQVADVVITNSDGAGTGAALTTSVWIGAKS